MGCDINLFVEESDGSSWRFVEPAPEPCVGCADTGGSGCWVCMDRQISATGTPGVMRGHWYATRHRLLFEALSGFHRIVHVTPISPARGLPQDLSSDLAQVVAWWGDDVLDPSWLTLREALDWPGWDEPIRTTLGYEVLRTSAADFLEALARIEREAGQDARIVFSYDC